jgi:hypothetical protein
MLFTGSWLVTRSQEKPEVEQLFGNMLESIRKIKTCSFVLDLDERVSGRLRKAQYITKVNTHPFKVYAYSVFPNPGAEALYLENHNNGKVLVNPNRFPFVNLNLSVNSMLLRKNHQYSILEMGFTYFHDIMEDHIRKHGVKFYETLSLKQDTLYNHRHYYIMEINNSGFAMTTYRVEKDENVTTIARKLLVNDHMILELNPGISDYSDVKQGQVIKVPNSFARKIVLYIDKITLLPLVQLIYDEKGFYSRIEISSFRVNPEIESEEFSSNFSKYNF